MSTEKNKTSLDVNEALTSSEAFVVKNKKAIIAGLIALVVVVGGFFATKYLYLNPRQEKASTLLALGQNYLIMSDYDSALNGDKKTFPGYLKIAAEYSLTDAGNLANFYAGICYAKKGETKKAIEFLEKFSPKGDETLSPAALAALANCYATDNQLDKAIETFKKAAKKADNSSLSPIYLLEAGKLLESQKKNSEALALYQQIKNDYPTSSLAAPVQQGDKVMSPEIDKYIERASK